MRPLGGSTTSDVRRPVGFADVNTALYAPATSWALPRLARSLRPASAAAFSSRAVRSSSVKKSLSAYWTGRSNGVSNSSSQMPCRSGCHHGVRGAGPAFAFPALAVPAAPPAAGAWPEAAPCSKTARAVMTTAKPHASKIRRLIVVLLYPRADATSTAIRRQAASELPRRHLRAVSGHASPTAIAHHPHVGVAQVHFRALPLPDADQVQREPDDGRVAVYPDHELVLNRRLHLLIEVGNKLQLL